MRVLLGNDAPVEVHYHDPDSLVHSERLEVEGGDLGWRDGYRRVDRSDLGASVTDVVVPEGTPVDEVLSTVRALWEWHSDAPAPGFVTLVSEDEELSDERLAAQAIAAMWGVDVRVEGPVALLTNAGKDVVAAQLSGAASATAVAKWIALTANSTAPAAGDTTLTGEIATAGGGLLRATATYAHTAGTNTYTLSKTFTANGSDALPVTVAKFGVFDAASAGNMVFETLISPTATLSASGDNVALTETVTIS